MRTTIVGVLVLIMITTIWNLAHTADPPPPQFPGPYPVDLKVGEIFVVSKSIEIVNPVKFPICDDLKVVDVVETPDGLAFKGIAPGKTLCSVSGGATMSGGLGPRRVFAITVHEE
jgi:hypothetical protein